MRICVVYDCLFPWTVGGAERWLRDLSVRLAGAGHDVTYLTRRQWEPGDEPRIPGVRVIAVSPAEPLYGPDGSRRIGPPLRFGRGVLGHLLRHRGDYDVVHTCAFPYFSLLAARLALAGAPVRIGVDWFEVWSRSYWRRYLGGAGGLVGWIVQRLCVRATPLAFVFSGLHARRLAEEGLPGDAVRLAGLYDGPLEPAPGAFDPGAPPLVLFAGRHIPEKRVPAVPGAVAAARAQVPTVEGLVLGDGPERDDVLDAIDAAGASAFVRAPGFVAAGAVRDAMGRATCLLLPSTREGYGLVVIEAAALGTPSIVVAGEDNAAVELVEDGVNGVLAPSDRPEDLAAAIVRCVAGGAALRASTAAWFAQHAPELQLASSAERVLEEYAR